MHKSWGGHGPCWPPRSSATAPQSSLHRLARTGRILAKNDRTLQLCNLDRTYADLVRFNTSIVMPLSRITAIDATTTSSKTMSLTDPKGSQSTFFPAYYGRSGVSLGPGRRGGRRVPTGCRCCLGLREPRTMMLGRRCPAGCRRIMGNVPGQRRRMAGSFDWEPHWLRCAPDWRDGLPYGESNVLGRL
jgi:hypothetical protein